MATPRKTLNNHVVTLDQIYNGDAETPAFDPGTVGEDLSDDLALQSTLATLGDDESNAKVYVYAVSDNGKDAYMYSCSATEFASGGLDEIQKRYGGGDYKVRVMANGKMVSHRRISIKEAKNPAPEAAALSGISDLAQVMQKGFEGMAQILMASAQANKPAPQESRSDMLREMMLMKELFASSQPAPQNNMMETLGMVKEMLSITQSLNPPTGADGGTDPMAVLWKGLEMFGKPLVEGMAAAKAGAVQQPAQMMQPAPQVPAISAPVYNPNPAQETGDDMNFFVKQVIKQIVSKAQEGVAPEIVAEMVIDQAPAALVNELADDPAWFANLIAINPDVISHRAWFEKMHVHIVKELTEDDISGNHAPIEQTSAPGESQSSA